MKNRFSFSKDGLTNVFRYGWGYIFRWLFIALSFFYLLTLTIALHEALSFQHYVGSLFKDNDAAARRVLVELYNHIDQQDRDQHGQRSQTAIGAMAIRLDAINNAVNALRSYQLYGERAGERSIPENDFREKVDKIELNVNNLHRLLSESSDDLRIVEHFIVIEQLVKDIKTYNAIGSIPKSYANATHTTFGKKDAALYQDTLHQLSDSLESLENHLKNSEFSHLSDQFPAMKAKLKELKELPANGSPESEKIVVEIDQSISSVKEKALDAGQQFNQELFLEIENSVKTLAAYNNPTGAAPTLVGGETKPRPEAPDREDFTYVVDGLYTTLVELEKNLGRSKNYQEIGLIRQIASTINSMKASVAFINRLPQERIEVIPIDKGENQKTGEVPETVQLMFKQSLGRLSDAIDALENDFSSQKRASKLAIVIGDDPDAQMKAQTILTDFESLSWFDTVLLPFNHFEFAKENRFLYNAGLNTRYITTLSNESLTLMFVFVIGAIGSLLYITKYYLQMALNGKNWLDEPSRPLSWYFFRPIFGVVVALAVYLMVRAGQMAFGGGDSFGDLNLPIFSVVALFAGLLSWQALEAIESKGELWFETQTRKKMWATGLEQALRIEEKSIAECANQIGRSLEQVERWLMFRDQVTPEIQDRMRTWLDRPIRELFSDKPPREQPDQKPLWATGLKNALQNSKMNLDSKTLAELLGEYESECNRVQKWIDLELQVSPHMQWLLVDVLKVPHKEIFEPDKQKRSCWATKLRVLLETKGKKAQNLSDELGIDVKIVHRWMDLDEKVPPEWQTRLEAALEESHRHIFTFKRPQQALFKYAVLLRDRLQPAGIRGSDLADGIDADLYRVYDWLEMDAGKGRVPPSTQKSITTYLAKNKINAEDIFSENLDAQQFARASGLGEALQEKGISEEHFAELIDIDLSRLRDWIAGKKQVAEVSQQRTADQLQRTKEELFP